MIEQIASYIQDVISGLPVKQAQDIMNAAYNKVWLDMTCQKKTSFIEQVLNEN